MLVETLNLDVEKRFGDFQLAVKADMPLDGITAIFGPSGSGKSSLLRLITGFEEPDKGHIRFVEQVWAGRTPRIFVPPHRRDVAYVFQGGRLLNHLSVRGNLDYADKRSKARPQTYSAQDVISTFDLGSLMARKPETLSGGERQRVALGQALLTRPRLLLLDEPLSALDERRKLDILPYLDRLQSQFGIPMIYVSHDLREVTRIADHVLILEEGQARAFGKTVETLNAHGFNAEGNGKSGVILTGQVVRFDQALELMEIAIGAHTLRLPYDVAQTIGSPVRVIVKASEIALSIKAPEGLSIQNSFKGHVKAVREIPDQALAWVTVSIGEDMELPVQVTRAAVQGLALKAGLPVYALVKTASLMG